MTIRYPSGAASLYIGGKKVADVTDGEVSFEPEPDDSGWSVEESTVATAASFSSTLESPASADLAAACDAICKLFDGSRRMPKIRSRYSRKRTGPYFCPKCLAIGKARPVMTLYGMRAHLAQERHGHRGFVTSARGGGK